VSTEIVVGYDASADATTALDWAVAVAQSRAAPVCVLTTVRYTGVPTPALAGAPELTLDLAGLSRDAAEEGRLRAAKVLGESAVRAVSDVGGPAAAIVEASTEAALVVVGHSGRGRLLPILLGSVAFAVAAHAHCPVAVVRGERVLVPGPTHAVVVGTDGSTHAEAAVRYAAAEAARWGAPLEVVAVWAPPPVEPWRHHGTEAESARELGRLLHDAARQAARDAEDLARRAHPELEVNTHLVEGDPAEVILERAQGSGLIVVGSRGLRGVERLLGSVGRAVLHAADRPVVVVRS
jgi:nucleotide-binding universal stress UspA family protein